MNNLDSITIKINSDCIDNLDLSQFDYNESYRLMEVEKDVKKRVMDKRVYTLMFEVKPYGVKRISVVQEVGQDMFVFVECSAKVLKENYFDLINLNTIKQTIENWNNKGISFNADKVVESGEVLKVDITNNLKVSRPVPEYMSVLQKANISHKYNPKPYDNNGMTFIKDVKGKYIKDRLIVYDKFVDVRKDKELNEYIKTPYQFAGVFRVESNLRHHAQTSRLLEISHKPTEGCLLIDVLNSSAKVNYKIYQDVIIVDEEQLALFDFYKKNDYYWSDIIQMEGWEGVIKKLNGNKKLIRRAIREHTPKGTKPTYQYGLLDKYLSLVRAKDNKDIVKENELLAEIRELLKVG